MSYLWTGFMLVPFLPILFWLKRAPSIANFLPSLFWFSLMVIPFLSSKEYFSQTSRTEQAIGITLISLTLVAGDILPTTKVPHLGTIEPPLKPSFELKNPLTLLFLILSVIVPVLIYFNSGEIPILELLRERSYDAKVATSRANYTKMENPYLLTVLGNWVVNFFAPFLIALLIHSKKYIKAALLVTWTLFFTLSSAAQGPSLNLIFTLTVLSLIFRPDFLSRSTKVLAVFVFFFFSISSITIGNHLLEHSKSCVLPIGVPKTPANLLRVCDDSIDESYLRERLAYRVFYVPVEVSNFWYVESINQNSSNRNLTQLLKRSTLSTHANEIGRKYYFERFPDKYAPYVTAYASIDADAYSFGGLPMVFLFALLLLFLRLICTSKGQSTEELILRALSLSMLSYLPHSASFQAIIFSQGFWLIIFFGLILRYTFSYQNNKNSQEFPK